MGPIELFISGLLVNAQPLLAFLGVSTSVVSVQLAVLAAVAFSIIGALIFSVYFISKMVTKSDKGEGIEVSDDEEFQAPEMSENEEDIKPPKFDPLKKEAEPEENIDSQAEVLLVQQAAAKATAALNSATQVFAELKTLCSQMTDASEEYENCEEDFEDIKDKARKDCIQLAIQIKALVPILKKASTDAKQANTDVKKIAAKLKTIASTQQQVLLAPKEANKNDENLQKIEQEFANTVKLCKVIDNYVQAVDLSAKSVAKISADFSKLTGKAHKEFDGVVPPEAKPVAKP